MHKKSTIRIMRYAVLMLIGLASAGCEKLNTATQTAPAIPADRGELVAVTPGDGPRQAVLWFKQADQTIVAVRVFVPRGTTKYPRG
jgi:hypothetical protein